MKTKNYNKEKLLKSIQHIEFTLKNILAFCNGIEHEDRIKIYQAYENVSNVGRKLFLLTKE